MHENALALYPRDDVGMGEQRFDGPPACGFVLSELRPVQIKSDEDAAFRRVGQRLDDSRVRENVRRHVDRQFGAADLPSVEALKVFARRIMDLRLGSLGLPLDLGPHLRPSSAERRKSQTSAEK